MCTRCMSLVSLKWRWTTHPDLETQEALGCTKVDDFAANLNPCFTLRKNYFGPIRVVECSRCFIKLFFSKPAGCGPGIPRQIS